MKDKIADAIIRLVVSQIKSVLLRNSDDREYLAMLQAVQLHVEAEIARIGEERAQAAACQLYARGGDKTSDAPEFS